MSISPARELTLSVASENDRQQIYYIRHQVYAKELSQYAANPDNELRDDLDVQNHYIVAKHRSKVIGFVSITPPVSKKYSVDKYFSRSSIPYAFDDSLYEVRLLTVLESERRRFLTLALMFAAFRWVQSHGGKYIVSICRSAILEMYLKAGLRPLRLQAVAGKVTYDLAVAEVDDLDQKVRRNLHLYDSLRSKFNWRLPFDFVAPPACFHGGSFFEAVGEDLQNLANAERVMNADVLDAWFPPSPKVIDTLRHNLSWLLKTSPPTNAKGLLTVISEVRGVREPCLLHGAGSSDLIFMAYKTLLNKNSRVLIIDPCYSEYVHVLENIIRCRVTRFSLSRDDKFVINTPSLLLEIMKGYDMVVIVNPNSPTGVYLAKSELEMMLREIPHSTLVWIDETYIEYAGPHESLEQFAGKSENVIVCKSMSKVYALSGVRVAYLCCSPHLVETLKIHTPPWAVGLPAQAAAIMALKDPGYYWGKYAETHLLRQRLKQQLFDLGIDVVEGVANFLLFYLPHCINLYKFLTCCKEEQLYLRDVSNMGTSLGKNAVRIAVKDETTNNKMIRIIKSVIERLTEV